MTLVNKMEIILLIMAIVAAILVARTFLHMD